MVIGTPRETHRHEHRVGLTPFCVSRLTQCGHTVIVEKEAGREALFSDPDYEEAGAQIVYDVDEVYGRSDLIARVGLLSSDEIERLKPGSVVCAFHHLAVASNDDIRKLTERKVTLIGYEIMEETPGEFPVRRVMSDLAGQMAIHVVARLLQKEAGGRGVLLGNAPGVPPPTVVILGAGSVGQAAAHQAVASGAHVIVLDRDLQGLRAVHRRVEGQVVTAMAWPERLSMYTSIADAVIGAILIPGGRTPYLVTEEMVRAMKPGAVIVDLSIDQGGCIETSRPTDLASPTYIAHDVVHYCVPNMTADIARTASRALANAALPYLMSLAEVPVHQALHCQSALAAGTYLYKGKIVHAGLAEAQGLPTEPLQDQLAAEQRS